MLAATSPQEIQEELELRTRQLEDAEARLKKLERRLDDERFWHQLLMEESHEGIVIIDHRGRVVEANPRYAEMLGYTMDEMLQLSVWDWDAQHTRAEIEEMIRGIDCRGQCLETQMRRRDGSLIDVDISSTTNTRHENKFIVCLCRDVTARKQAEREREDLIARLQESIAEIKTLRGILPLCGFCKKVRDDKGYWERVDVYIREHSDAVVSHGICPDCLREHYPEQADRILKDGEED